MESFKTRLNEALNKKSISAAELSRRTGIDEGTLSNYRKGKYIPKQRKLDAIASALNVSIPWLMGADVSMSPNETGHGAPDNIISLPSTKEIPLLGTIACGEPILAVENIDMYVKVDETVPANFALRCKGDSMINARIFDGDIVFIREQPDVENGEIAAVLIGEEATLKRVYKYPSKLVLSPCNPLYDDLIYTVDELDNIRILGKAVAFMSTVR